MSHPPPAGPRAVLLAAALALVLAAAGCSTASEASDEVATLQDTGNELEDAADAATGDNADAEPDLPPDEAALAFSQCMRDEGIDFPDLTVDAEGNIELRDAFQTVDRGADGFREATEACGELLEQTAFGGGNARERLESPEVQDALLEFSECVRAEGFDVGDLTLGQGQGGGGQPPAEGGQGAGQQGERAAGFGDRGARFADNLGLDYEDPDVAAAIDGCIPIVDEAFSTTLGQPRG